MVHQPKYRHFKLRDLGFVEYNKKRIYFNGRYASERSLAEYKKFLVDLGFLVPAVGTAIGSPLIMPLLVRRFTNWADTTYPGGRKSRAANLKTFTKLLTEFFGEDLAINFTPLKFKAFQQWMIDRNASRRYINDACAGIRFMFKWAVSEELLPITLYQSLCTVQGIKRGRTAAKEHPPRQPVEWKHVKATLRKLNKRVAAMVEFQWLTGVRSQSLCSARVGEFDTTKQPWEWRPKHKTEHLGHELIVYVGPKAQKIVAGFLKNKEPADYVFQPRSKTGKRSKLYRSFYDADTYRRAVQRAADKAKVPKWSPHRIRHARGTLVRERFGLEAAQAALGHARINATQIYAQAQREKARKVAATMG